MRNWGNFALCSTPCTFNCQERRMCMPFRGRIGFGSAPLWEPKPSATTSSPQRGRASTDSRHGCRRRAVGKNRPRRVEAQWNELQHGIDRHPPGRGEHVELAQYTTFGIEAKARWFAEVTSVDGLRAALDWSRSHGVEVFVLGGEATCCCTATWKPWCSASNPRWYARRRPPCGSRRGRWGGVARLRHAHARPGMGRVGKPLALQAVWVPVMQNIGAYGVESVIGTPGWTCAHFVVPCSDSRQRIALLGRESVFKREEASGSSFV